MARLVRFRLINPCEVASAGAPKLVEPDDFSRTFSSDNTKTRAVHPGRISESIHLRGGSSMRRRGLLSLLAVSALAAGCGSGAAGGGALAQGGTFTMALTGDPGNLNPLMTVLQVTRHVDRLAYDSLLRQKTDGSFAPNLAEKWDVTPTKTTFTLRQNIACSDGSKLMPEDVAANINFVADPKSKSPLLGVFLSSGSSAKGDNAANTVTVTTPKPEAFLLQNMANLMLVCKAGLDDPSKLAQRTIGTGPWTLSEAVPDDHYTFTKNTGYAWGPDETKMTGVGVPDEVSARVVTNSTTTANLLLSGEVNYGTVSPPDRPRLEGAKLESLLTATPLGETWFNEAAGRPGADPEVREALITGSNIDQIAKVATAGKGVASTGLVTLSPKPCSGDTVAGNLPAYDMAKAKQILDAAGWTAGPDGTRSNNGTPLAFRFIYPAGRGDAIGAGAELLAQQWGALGAKVTLRSVTSAQLNEVAFSTGAWDAGWISVSVFAPSQLTPFVSGPAAPEGTNFAHLNNATYHADSAKASALIGTQACDLWNSAESGLVKAQDVTPMFNDTDPSYLKKATLTAPGGELWASSIRLLTA
jgi:peptide/nickel transport system substrate-binding protein